ncbi:ceramidase [Ignatzschineria rhizosphaerae]|uniref:Ceramidase n=1 Tax=Ignatzschineria rhizosphaerae TaxID=2923279 RepID=A0ABY3X0T8_9GAMM|nr:ceramidase domain-containing protein [Ignatzschineria rhizosphaerae]UNM96479.1 ceramidase [Ignatzschineria rhizosphaerae]
MTMCFIRQQRTFDIVFYSVAILFLITFYWGLPLYSQPEHYHQFSGDEMILGIPNFMNVASNIFYILAGLIGLYRVQYRKVTLSKSRWRTFFIALIFVGFGSSYYHLSPSTHTLFWDRLPMSIGFALLSANFLAERYPACKSKATLLLLLGFSIYSVLHWHLGELMELGDLRLYAITQFATIALIAIILIFKPQNRLLDRPYWILLVGYTIAKICEMLDPMIFALSHQLLGGHVIKHIISGIALILFIPSPRTFFHSYHDILKK